VAIVTGGAGGIGLGIARRLAQVAFHTASLCLTSIPQDGARVVLTDVSATALAAAKKSLAAAGVAVDVMTVDGTKKAEVARARESTL
jgi:NAD(P)-dependent dehydrogenase (short-subunit alcohol dehydrogenase family)